MDMLSPRSTNRSSFSECSGSWIKRALSSKNAVFASAKEIPCLRRLAAFFFSSPFCPLYARI
jgi:hypothetical protein